jgi:hypothetical protein
MVASLVGCSSDSDDANGDEGSPDGGTDGTGGGGGGGGGGGSAADDACDVVVPDADCDTSLMPIVFIHGTFGSATEISNTAQLFGSNGYCQDRFVAVEYNSLGASPIEQLSELIDQVRADTGFDKVVLSGHSQGTGHACAYLEVPGNTDKVANYMNISGGCDGRGVPTLSLSSENDLVGGPVHPMTGDVERVTLVNEDHVALAGSKEAFKAMYRYVLGQDPEYTKIQCGQERVVIDGKMVSLGDNEPKAGGKLEVYRIDELEDTPWERGAPDQTIMADGNGHIHAELDRGVAYEFRQFDADGTLIGNTYRAPLMRSDYLARFLSESGNTLVADATTNRITRSDQHAVIAARYLAGVFRKDWNNSLMIDGNEVLTDENAGKSSNVTGLFMYDDNLNGESDLGVVYNLSFLWHSDVFVDASTPRWIDIEWTNEEDATAKLKIPNWKSSETYGAIYLPYP